MAHILLADDDPVTLDMLGRALAADGHKVTVAQDGQEACDRLLAAPGSFDLMISDVEMPGLDGITLAERAFAAVPQLRIILMSGFAAGVDRAGKVRTAGVRFISKPFTLEQVRAEVRAALA
jgi:CheY-like chemotaxis protein